MIRNLFAAGAIALAISPALAQDGAEPARDHIRLPFLTYPADRPAPPVKAAPRSNQGHRVLEGHRSTNARGAAPGARIRSR